MTDTQITEIKQTFDTIPENEYRAQVKSVLKTTNRRGIYNFCIGVERMTAAGTTYYYEVERNLTDVHYVARTIKKENPDDLVQIIMHSRYLFNEPVIHTVDGGNSDNLFRLDVRDVDNEFPKIKFLGIQLTKKSGFLVLAKYKDEFRRIPVTMPGDDLRTQIQEFLLNPVRSTFGRYVEIYNKMFDSASEYVSQPALQPALLAA